MTIRDTLVEQMQTERSPSPNASRREAALSKMRAARKHRAPKNGSASACVVEYTQRTSRSPGFFLHQHDR